MHQQESGLGYFGFQSGCLAVFACMLIGSGVEGVASTGGSWEGGSIGDSRSKEPASTVQLPEGTADHHDGDTLNELIGPPLIRVVGK